MRAASIFASLFLSALLLAIVPGCERDNLPVPKFSTGVVFEGPLIDSVLATGRVETLSSINVSSQLSGRLERVSVDFNDDVSEGQPLAMLDQQRFLSRVEELKAALAVAEAELEMVEASLLGARAKLDEDQKEYQRKESLVKTGNVSKRDLSQSESILRQSDSSLKALLASKNTRIAERAAAQASLRQAEIDLERTVIRSPIDGVVINRSIDPGQTVAASLEAPELFIIAHNLKEIEIHASVDEADIGKIRVGQAAHFMADAFPSMNFEGTVRQLRKFPQLSQNVVSYTVVVAAENTKELLLPGMTVLVEIISAVKEKAIQVPNAALRFVMSGQQAKSYGNKLKGNQSVVWVEEKSGQYTPKIITLGYSDGEFAEVLAGDISVGDKIIIGYKK